jgi:hypothetical protein
MTNGPTGQKSSAGAEVLSLDRWRRADAMLLHFKAMREHGAPREDATATSVNSRQARSE